jgi:hypothetical protein
MPPWVDKSIILEDVRIIFRNFSGGPERFNPSGGKRNFSIVLDEHTADRLKREGWNVKEWGREDSEEPPVRYLKVNVKFPNEGSRGKPPTLVLITSKGRRIYTEETIDAFDIVEIESVDVKIRPYDGEMNGRPFRSAYLVAIYVQVYEDELAKKWNKVPEVGQAENYPLEITMGDERYDDSNVQDAEVLWDSDYDDPRKELTA